MLPTLKGMTKGQVRRGRKNSYVIPVAFLVILFLIGQIFWLDSNRHMFMPFSIAKLDCDYCTKLGIVRDPNDSRIMAMCQVCFGVGYKMIRKFDELDVVCAACGGMGRIDEDGRWRTCQRCDGRGIHRADDWKRIVEVDERMKNGNQLSTFNTDLLKGTNEPPASPDPHIPNPEHRTLNTEHSIPNTEP